MSNTLGVLATIGIVGFSGAAIVYAPHAYASPVMEDMPQWDCRANGNFVCGPNNSQGATAGCYNDTGLMVAPWPCHVVVNPDGSADAYEGA